MLGKCIAAIEHFGSTAVPGSIAKPIIDILVATIDGLPPTEAQIEALGTEGYVYLGEDGRRPGRWFWRKRGPMDFNLSLVPFESDLWRDNLIVRNYLRMHPEDVQQYAMTKREAVRASPNSLLGYQEHKRSYMHVMHRPEQTNDRCNRSARTRWSMTPDMASAALAQKTAEYKAAQATAAGSVAPPPAGTPETSLGASGCATRRL